MCRLEMKMGGSGVDRWMNCTVTAVQDPKPKPLLVIVD